MGHGCFGCWDKACQVPCRYTLQKVKHCHQTHKKCCMTMPSQVPIAFLWLTCSSSSQRSGKLIKRTPINAAASPYRPRASVAHGSSSCHCNSFQVSRIGSTRSPRRCSQRHRPASQRPALTTFVILISVWSCSRLLSSVTSLSTCSWYSLRLSAGNRSTLLS